MVKRCQCTIWKKGEAIVVYSFGWIIFSLVLNVIFFVKKQNVPPRIDQVVVIIYRIPEKGEFVHSNQCVSFFLHSFLFWDYNLSRIIMFRLESIRKQKEEARLRAIAGRSSPVRSFAKSSQSEGPMSSISEDQVGEDEDDDVRMSGYENEVFMNALVRLQFWNESKCKYYHVK